MKEIGLVIELQLDTPKVLCGIFKNTITVHKDGQGAIALKVSPQIWPHTKHITIKYHQNQSFVANRDVYIQHIDTKE